MITEQYLEIVKTNSMFDDSCGFLLFLVSKSFTAFSPQINILKNYQPVHFPKKLNLKLYLIGMF